MGDQPITERLVNGLRAERDAAIARAEEAEDYAARCAEQSTKRGNKQIEMERRVVQAEAQLAEARERLEWYRSLPTVEGNNRVVELEAQLAEAEKLLNDGRAEHRRLLREARAERDERAEALREIRDSQTTSAMRLREIARAALEGKEPE